eukprot:CAMPEP_0168522946 /NCGR_PEP_ID=MMETSP0405-20121227/9663_1 /TAXON_ID=498012 /ORGANISM="Trichosphaerium sp, Strain Am-I-7 wt" /LENGTH=236 /DNA_ID=CAMNT_0008544671 /DNA_START=647 /DNA_END=1354 /DNA_ORIENTATION=-
MVHGTSPEAALSIVKAGFGTVSSLDGGYYGQGIYFTSSLEYACSYDTSGNRELTLVLSLVTPGNVYPVTEKPNDDDNFYGKPIKPGYQSHYTLVDKKGIVVAEDKVNKAMRDELVVAQDVQAVARYIIKVVKHKRKTSKSKKSKPKNKTQATKTSTDVTDVEHEADSDNDELSDDEENLFKNRQLWGATSLNKPKQLSAHDLQVQVLSNKIKEKDARLEEKDTEIAELLARIATLE